VTMSDDSVEVVIYSECIRIMLHDTFVVYLFDQGL
jgi:hypothetical protein